MGCPHQSTAGALMKRGIGYCINEECEQVYRDTFVVSPSGCYRCTRCGVEGKTETERGYYKGYSDIFNEVRVEFNFDTRIEVYREIAIVRDEFLSGDHNVYTLHAPLTKSPERALKIAESLLGNLNRYNIMPKSGEVPQTKPFVISFDESLDDVKEKCQELYMSFDGSPMTYWRNKYER